MRAITKAVCLSAAAAVLYAAGGPQLHGRIAGKQGPQNARQWTFEVSGGQNTLADVEIQSLQLTQTSGDDCRPAIVSPSTFPYSLGKLPAGGTAQATVTIDFSGCPNQAHFTVDVRLGGSGGARGTIRRSNGYR